MARSILDLVWLFFGCPAVSVYEEPQATGTSGVRADEEPEDGQRSLAETADALRQGEDT